uniref:Uncharacterized protein n=1 Tax=Solanum lycopersicum TaxID=4081 RepID=A0A3Q7EZM2_SOLLC
MTKHYLSNFPQIFQVFLNFDTYMFPTSQFFHNVCVGAKDTKLFYSLCALG